ncbi:MAG: molybdate ABC transporter substrate-binding protein [Henriciella sp.]|uniref:molybdate ABC transporter substrate-binding protein n=1 Tax=Henriciella sp. TaxID=1968823 RepID=UPI0032EFB9B2
MLRLFLRKSAFLVLLLPVSCGDGRPAGDALVAVATNFREVAEVLEADFEASTGYEISVASGSTGQLYTQITNGAPFDILLAADQIRPEMLQQNGNAVAATRFTYAIGKLVLWSADGQTFEQDGEAVLREGDFRALAIANPDLAPYGTAAMEVIGALGLAGQLQDKIVRGENVGQALAIVTSGNAELGFVALSQIASPGRPLGGSYWQPPQSLHSPIRQDAILLERASENEAARGFIDYLKTEEARETIAAYGYETG